MICRFRQHPIGSILFASLLLTIVVPSPSKAQVRIGFASGSDSGSWSGSSGGMKRFVLNLGRGQMFWVTGKDVLNWRLITPSRLENSCSLGCRAGVGARLPETGDYIVEVVLPKGYATVGFTAR
jgi:hypothetical protein